MSWKKSHLCSVFFLKLSKKAHSSQAQELGCEISSIIINNFIYMYGKEISCIRFRPCIRSGEIMNRVYKT